MSGGAISLDGENEVRIVGTSYYRDAIEAGLEGRWPRDVVIELRPEPENPHDRNAIAAYLAGRKVGHLSREDALAYRAAFERIAARGQVATCPGSVFGASEADHSFGIRVYMVTPIGASRRSTSAAGGPDPRPAPAARAPYSPPAPTVVRFVPETPQRAGPSRWVVVIGLALGTCVLLCVGLMVWGAMQ